LSIGYGDIHATNMNEYAYSIIAMLSGGILFGAVTAQVTRVIEGRNPSKRAFKEQMDEIKSFLGEKHDLPMALRQRALDAYSFYLQRKSSFGESDIFEELPRPIFARLVFHAYERELKSITFFRDADPSFAAELITHVRPFYVRRGETIYEEGDVALDIVFVLHGKVRLVHKVGETASIVGYVDEGGYFGDFEYHQKSTRLVHYQATKNCSLLALSFAKFDEECDDHVDAGIKFKEELRQRYATFRHVTTLPWISSAGDHDRDRDGIHHPSSDDGADSSRGISVSARELLATVGSTSMKRLFSAREGSDLKPKRMIWLDGQLSKASYHEEDQNIFFEKQIDVFRFIVPFKAVGTRDGSSSYVEIVTEESLQNFSRRYFLHPMGRFKLFWDSFIGCWIVYSVLFIPIQVGAAMTRSQIALAITHNVWSYVHTYPGRIQQRHWFGWRRQRRDLHHRCILLYRHITEYAHGVLL
jgi:CRP-like cAMP-binding protein